MPWRCVFSCGCAGIELIIGGDKKHHQALCDIDPWNSSGKGQKPSAAPETMEKKVEDAQAKKEEPKEQPEEKLPAECKSSYRALSKAFPSKPHSELRRFARTWPSAEQVVKMYEKYVQWRKAFGEPASLAKALRCVPPFWILGAESNATPRFAKDGSRVIFVQGARTDFKKHSPEVYVKAICGTIDETVLREKNGGMLTMVIDTRGGDGWPNPTPWDSLPFFRGIACHLPSNYPCTLQRIIIYPLPSAVSTLVSLILKLVDPVVRSKICLIYEEKKGGFIEGLREHLMKESLPEHCWPSHEGL